MDKRYKGDLGVNTASNFVPTVAASAKVAFVLIMLRNLVPRNILGELSSHTRLVTEVTSAPVFSYFIPLQKLPPTSFVINIIPAQFSNSGG